MDEQKQRQTEERRSFDPAILNFTLTTMQKSISQNARHTSQKFSELKEMIAVLQKENRIKNSEIYRVDKEFSICRAGKDAGMHSEEKTNFKRNAVLFNILAFLTAMGALTLGILNYFKRVNG